MLSKIVKSIIIMIILCVIVPQLKAQDSLTYALGSIAIVRDRPGINIGEQVPNLSINKVINYKKASLQFDELKGKPTILQFWHQFCPVCRGEFVKLERLKQQFEDSINFLLVTFQSEASVKSFFREQKKAGKAITLPTVTEDTLLRKTFPHDGDPHIIWMSKDGIVQAITNHLALTKGNLERWLHDGNIRLPVKSMQPDFDIAKPLLVNNNGGRDDAFTYRSMITGFIDSIPATAFIVDRDSIRTRLFISNSTIDHLFKELYIKYDTAAAKFLDLDWLNKRIIVNYKDSSLSTNWEKAYQTGFDVLDDFQRKHMFTYELILPASYSKQDAMLYMKQDLERYFRIRSSIERRTIKGLALIRTNNVDKIRTMGGPRICKTTDDSVVVCKNSAMWSLVNVLNLNFDIPFVVDETNYRNNIDITIPYAKDDVEKVRKSLHAYGLDLVAKEYQLDMLVLNEKE